MTSIADRGQADVHNTKVFITLACAELRTIFLRHAQEIRNLRGDDIGMPNLQNLRIDIYEDLTGPRQNLFSKMREKANQMGVFKIWQWNGVICTQNKAILLP